ncbi:autotransporter outer membrane beta-barrel domain-containing protein [Mesorhizobium qingshengii]|uniref:Autotransporter outer membrane beta-barrel domain-containing protein n=1 Tax=Mesorhizobium qingshengii TaxID=1165689 RepID=A0ABT4QWX2_9HYPH|nr:autotransporter domain-containing protein [Mesorhizobium qingshengii]MCZ8546090.1 autotransporter outer membrane beta-barrel domain-containing protein [Mesorhizobium qingshengii]
MRHLVFTARAEGEGNARPACSLFASTSLPALLTAGLVAVAMTPIVSGVASAADFVHGSGNWGTAANWTPATVPNGVDAVANFDHDAPDQGLGYGVDLSGGPYTVGTLNLNATSTSGGYRFTNGVLNFEASGQAAINVQTNNLIPDLDAGASFNLISDTVFTVDAGAHFTADGVISGAGGLTKNGDGLLTLNGANTYAGGTNLYGGTLSLGNNDALGTGSLAAFSGTVIDLQDGVTINNNLTIDLSQNINVASGATGTYAGQISEFSDPSTIVKTGAGTLVLTNNSNSFSSGARIEEGTIRVTADHALGSGPITLDSGTLQAGANLTLANVSILFGAAGGTIDTNGFDVSTTASMGDNDTPSGTFTKTGAGTLTVDGFAGNNTYATATDVAQGTLKAGATNIFSANSAYTVDSGATLALNNFSQVIGSLAGAGTVDGGTGKLTTGGNNGSTVFSGGITGTGGLIKDGTGTFELSGSSTLSGATEVKAGTLLVSGSLAGSAVSVDSGATLAGGGTVGSLDASGTVAPGNDAIGTLAVNGTAKFESGSTYAVELNSAGLSDLIDASGAATIDNGAGLTVTNIGLGGLVAGTRYTVLVASSVTGTFTLVGDPQVSAFASLSTTSDATHAYVDVTQTKTFGSAGLTPNQIATGQGLDSAAGSALVSAVLALPSDAAAQAAFDQLSGEIHASAKGMLLQDSHFLQDAVTARLRGAFGDSGKTASLPVMAYGEEGVQPVVADTDRFAVWAQGFGSWGGTDSDGNAAAFDRSTGGLLMGADGLAGAWRVGVVGGYSRTSFNADDGRSSGDSDNYHLGLYGGTNWGAVALRTGAAYTWHRISTSRSVALQGFTDSLSADYDAATAQAFGELAYKTDAGPFAFEPFANLAYVNLHTDGFTESGGAAALTSGSTTTDATFTTLGVRASTDVTVGGVTATARGMFGWRHAFGDVTPLSTFAFAGGGDFTIAGVPISRDAMLVEAGFDVQLAQNATLGLSYAGQFGPDAFDNGFKANLGVKF